MCDTNEGWEDGTYCCRKDRFDIDAYQGLSNTYFSTTELRLTFSCFFGVHFSKSVHVVLHISVSLFIRGVINTL